MAKIVPNDKGIDEVIDPKRVKVKATNEPEMDKTVYEKDENAPTGKAES